MQKSLYLALLLFFSVATASGATREEVVSAVTARYQLTTPAFLGGFKKTGSVLTPRREGLRANRPSKAFKPNLIKNNQLVSAGGGELPLGAAHSGALKPGDGLYLYEVKTGEDFVQLDLFTVASYVVPGVRGATPLQASVRFQYDRWLAELPAAQVLDDIGDWFAVEGAEPKAPNAAVPRAAGSSTRTVHLGQTTEEVAAILGPPEKKILLGKKTFFVYGPLKIVFVDGKVVDAE